MDNAKEFHSHALVRGAQEYGIEVNYRPVLRPRYGGHIERLIGTTMGAVHLLPGTTFSNVQEKGSYNSEKEATMTIAELERWLALEIGRYHQSVHSSLRMPPLAAWKKGMLSRGPLRQVENAKQFFCDSLPGEHRMIRGDEIRLFNIHYMSDVLTAMAGRSEKAALIKYDPRDLSRVYLRDDDGHNGGLRVVYHVSKANEQILPPCRCALNGLEISQLRDCLPPRNGPVAGGRRAMASATLKEVLERRSR